MRELILLFIFYAFNLQSKAQIKAREEIIFDSLLKIKQNCIGKKITSFNTITLKGEKFSNKSLFGKITFVNFWFESCAPCINEIPYLNLLYRRYSNNKQFQLIAFTTDYPDKAQKAKDKYKIRYPVLPISNKDCQDLMCLNGFPTNMIIDDKGIIIFLHIGGFLDIQDFKKMVYPKVDSLLKNK